MLHEAGMPPTPEAAAPAQAAALDEPEVASGQQAALDNIAMVSSQE